MSIQTISDAGAKIYNQAYRGLRRRDTESAAVIKAVADLGSRLGVSTVAEGVETQAQLDRVREEGCTEIQGYLYGRPAPNDRDAAKIEELNNARKVTTAA